MPLPTHKTKIVCTIGPASAKPDVLAAMMKAGMNVCRLNFAHGDFDSHAATIRLIRETAKATGDRIAILADLPGPKIRLGTLCGGRLTLEKGAKVTLTTDDIEGTPERLPVQFPELPQSVQAGDSIFLNDGFLHLTVEGVDGSEVACTVDVGGLLLSNKGVNIPGKELPVKAFTPRDHEVLKFAVEHGVDAVSQSFVQRPEELQEVRKAAKKAGGQPLIFGKIERAVALRNIDSILSAADGIMVARGDLGVETPIEAISISQKRLIQQARRDGKLVITATQMLESMVNNARPTRAEATDVANAILDGTDCVMLSEESAMGQYPVEAVGMLASIAAVTEAGWYDPSLKTTLPDPFLRLADRVNRDQPRVEDVIAYDVATAVNRLKAVIVVAPSVGSEQPRLVAAYRLPCWIVALSPSEKVCQELSFCHGVYPDYIDADGLSWQSAAEHFLRRHGLTKGLAVIYHRWSQGRSMATNRIEIVDVETYFGNFA